MIDIITPFLYFLYSIFGWFGILHCFGLENNKKYGIHCFCFSCFNTRQEELILEGKEWFKIPIKDFDIKK